ncbi:hypothetical protein V8C86DRAFT_2867265 [Haematococcus lacustris]
MRWQSWAALMSCSPSTTSSSSWSVSRSVHSSPAEMLPAAEGVGEAAGGTLWAAEPEEADGAPVARGGLSPSCNSWQAASRRRT